MKKYIFGCILLLYGLGNYYVFEHFYVLVKNDMPILQAVFWLVAAFLSGSIFVFYALSKYFNVTVASVFYKVGTGWLMLLTNVFLFAVFLDFLFWLASFSSWSSVEIIKDNDYVKSLALVLVTFVVALVGFSSYRKKNQVNIKLEIDKVIKRPVKIVFISDLHLGYAIQQKELKHWVEIINKQKADLVLIAGDIIDCDTRPLWHYKLAEYLKEIKAKNGVYCCLGNHEYLSGLQQSIDFLKASNIQVLKDKVSYLEDLDMYIIGRDDKTNKHRNTLGDLMSELDSKKMSVLLDHQPYDLDTAAKCQVDLQLSGHTHKGQVWPFSWITNILFEKSHGQLVKQNTHYYVSSGLGIWGGRYRLGTRSEYVIINVQQKED